MEVIGDNVVVPITQLLHQCCRQLYENLRNDDPINGSLTHCNCSNNGRILIDESFIKIHRRNGQLLQIEVYTVHFISLRLELVLFTQSSVDVVGLVCGGDAYVEGGTGQF